MFLVVIELTWSSIKCFENVQVVSSALNAECVICLFPLCHWFTIGINYIITSMTWHRGDPMLALDFQNEKKINITQGNVLVLK